PSRYRSCSPEAPLSCIFARPHYIARSRSRKSPSPGRPLSRGRGDPGRLDRRVLVNDTESRRLLDPSLTTIVKYRRLRLDPTRNSPLSIWTTPMRSHLL
ncbi:hypothetical protein T310_4796, partial [Rasamsonia emersonii CBS 393.64]